VDTTAAGDSMTAGLAVALGEGSDWPAALRFANAAGALACTALGARPSIPSRAQVLAFLGGT
jgi:sugar/nucleoside kinase (ribokinase family)